MMYDKKLTDKDGWSLGWHMLTDSIDIRKTKTRYYKGIKYNVSWGTIDNYYGIKVFEMYNGSELIGVATVQNTSEEYLGRIQTIKYFEICKNFKGMGFGKKLLEIIEHHIKRSGGYRVAVDDCDGALGFWKHMGFKIERVLQENGYKILI
jgi:GNAT superfamily N-acetyltransferase